MSDLPYPSTLSGSPVPLPAGPRRYPWWHWRRLGFNFLTICGSWEGSPVSMSAGQSYPIDVLIGEWPGGEFMAWLQFRKEGAEYKKDSKGNPILPLFRLASGTLPYANGDAPVYDKDGPIWKGSAATPATP